MQIRKFIVEDRCEVLGSFLFCSILLSGALLCFIHYRLCIHLNCQNFSDANVKTSFVWQRGHGRTFVCGVNQSVFQTKTNLDSALIRNGAAINFTDRRIHWSPFIWYSENSSFFRIKTDRKCHKRLFGERNKRFSVLFRREKKVRYERAMMFLVILSVYWTTQPSVSAKNKLVETRNKSTFRFGMLKFLFDF